MWSMWYSVIFTCLHHKLELLDKLNTYLCKYYPLKKICLHHPATFHKISIFLIFHYSGFWVMKNLELQKYKRRIEDWNGPSIRQLQENIPMPAILYWIWFHIKVLINWTIILVLPKSVTLSICPYEHLRLDVNYCSTWVMHVRWPNPSEISRVDKSFEKYCTIWNVLSSNCCRF